MGLTREQIDEAVKHEGWQKFRVFLKGKTTEHKLRQLALFQLARERKSLGSRSSNVRYWEDQFGDLPEQESVRVQILNYLNALSRGGQIDPLSKQDWSFDSLRDLLWKGEINVRR